MLLGGIGAVAALIAVAICACCGGFSGFAWLWMLPVGFLGSGLGLLILAFLFLWAISACVDLSRPQEHDSKFYRAATNLYLGAVRSILRMRVHTSGLEQTPKEGRFLLVCNHINDMDPLTLLMYFPDCQLAFITKRENARKFIVGKLMHKLMCQNLNRENDREALKTILNCVRLIQEDEVSIGVFPEGYTSRDGLFHHFRHGVFKIAQKTKAPIVICTLKNTNRIFKNALRLKPTQVELRLVRVLQPGDYEGLTAVQISEKVHKIMADDLGPELVAAR